MDDDSQFSQYLSELDSPNTEGYTFFTKNETDGYSLEIYRKYEEASGLYKYKSYGELKSIDTETVNAVYNDLEYRKKWDAYCADLHVISETSVLQNIYWRVAYPWPMSHRDYVFSRKSKIFEATENSPKRWCIIGKGDPSSCHEEVKGVIRVKDYEQTLALQPSKNGLGTKVFLYYFDNPGGALPTWVVNWAAKTGVPQFMKTLQSACEKFTSK
ncbi:phosphatidylcholine transfer protein-like [Bolinopsis microptera]|uniref:phosphatidylcholine transfer protein-like n=1 Tax=Bolinopsis microptera TaxID=2820187 RepID=UPI003079A54B